MDDRTLTTKEFGNRRPYTKAILISESLSNEDSYAVCNLDTATCSKNKPIRNTK